MDPVGEKIASCHCAPQDQIDELSQLDAAASCLLMMREPPLKRARTGKEKKTTKK